MPAAVLGLFDSVAQAFAHIAQDVSRKLAPAVGPMFGVPPEAVEGLARLVIKCHAGSSKAKARVAELQTKGGTFHGIPLGPDQLRAALLRINVAVHDHPHFAHMQAHATKALERAKGAAA